MHQFGKLTEGHHDQMAARSKRLIQKDKDAALGTVTIWHPTLSKLQRIANQTLHTQMLGTEAQAVLTRWSLYRYGQSHTSTSAPVCPFCNRFWEVARPWVDSGKVQLRHVIVGVIRPDSANKAASIFAAASPSEALARNELRYEAGGIAAAATVPADVRAKLDANEKLMTALGFQGTPGILFRDDKGIVQRRSGLPIEQDLTVVLGPR